MANIIGLAENQIVKPAENYSPLSKNLILSHDPVLLILIMINNIESVGKKIYDLDGDQLDFLQVDRVTPKGTVCSSGVESMDRSTFDEIIFRDAPEPHIHLLTSYLV